MQKNIYSKFIPNVWLAKCPEQHKRGEVITLTTKYGRENSHIVFNLIAEKEGFFYYSIVREDGFNIQERAKRKAERLQGFAFNAEKRSSEAYKRSDLSEAKTGIVFGQPILVGHHSERGHRRTIERARNAMDKSVEESNKAEQYQSRAAYWESQADTINLSMPESIEYYAFELEKAKARHQGLKDGTIERAHSYSLTYAKNKLNEIEKKYKLAAKLWGE